MDRTPDITLMHPHSPFLLNEQVFPPLGILYLSAWLKGSGYVVQCLDMALGHQPEEAEAEIVGVSFTTPQRFEAYELNKRLKRLGKLTIAGGPHATHMPEECIQHGFDYAVVGEGEIILDALLVFLTEEKLRERVRERIYYSEGLKTRSIDNVPFPDRQSIDISAYKYTIDGVPATTIMTSRGCPYSCSFCARVHEGCRLQSAERTYSEIVHLDTIFGFQAFMIFDDIFIVNRSRTRKLADLLEPYGFLFRCFARSNLITEDNCKQMKRMGVREVGIGVESGSNLVLKRNMKGTSREVNIKAFHTLQKYGIRAKAFLIVGLPGETEETIKETESWIEEAGPYDVDVSIFNPLPGSPIFSDPEKWGIQFHYDGNLNWYKGTPGTYSTTVRTEGLDSHEIVGWRDYLESKYKRKELLR